MAEQSDRRHARVGKRVEAAVALALLLVVFLLTIVFLRTQLLALLLGLLGSILLVAGGSWLVTKLMPRRLIGLVGALLGLLVLVVALALVEDGFVQVVWRVVVLVVVAAAQLAVARVALEGDNEPHEPDRAPRKPVRPSRPVLIYNERSGGGKLAQFAIIQKAQSLRIITIPLEEGDDLTALARQAVADGADCLGMAGGDGSQALVAAVAVEAGLPFVCVPTGTRNHFARDLGLDVTDPGSVLEAFVRGRRRRVDYGTVGDRLFVNNVSLGAYASITQSPDYRESKLGTTLALLPEIIGPEARPADLSFTTPEGEEILGATVLLVSNNSYALGLTADAASRPSISDGLLGVLAVRAQSTKDALAAVAQASLGLANAGQSLLAFDVKDFDVRSSAAQVDAAIDGEALTLDSPLRFAIHPRGLTLLLPRSARHRKRSISLRRLLAVARDQG